MSAPGPASPRDPSGTRHGRGDRWLALCGCFFASGFAALLYQTAWTRLFGAVFGTSELAVATVLAAYMAGLAAGAAVAARAVGRVRRPVRAYGLLELGIALAALAVPLVVRAAARLQVALLGGREWAGDAGGLASALFYLACAFAVLGLPTALMGATLPLLARDAVRTESELGRRVGTLYAVNTAGAIAGTLVAGFALLPALGLQRTVWVGVAVNAAVFALAVTIGRRRDLQDFPGDATSVPAPEAATKLTSVPVGIPALIVGAVAVSGAVSFAYEVLWTRLLGHVLGGSVYAFATMLASVLLGITAGGALAARFADSPSRAARGFALAQLSTAALAFVAFRALERVPDLAEALGAGGRSGPGANALLAMAVLVPPSLAIGASYPFAVRVLARDANAAGPASARIYAWNTLGAIVGSVAAGFFVLPALGFAGTLRVAVAVNLALAAAAAVGLAAGASRSWWLAGAALAGLAGLAVAPPGEPWRLLRSSPLARGAASSPVEYYAVGRAATVLLLREPGTFQLRTNGLPEASIARRGSRPHPETLAGWLGGLPVMLRPDTRRMAVVGLGGGVALESLPRTLEAVDVIELEPEVVEANRRVGDRRRRDPLADPRVAVRTNDARSALLLAAARYDAIVSQPSHPWSAGASHLYTREFFTLARDRLAPGGVFVQWVGLAFVDAELLRSVLATLGSVFQHVEVYRPAAMGVLLAASDAPFDPLATVERALAAAPVELAELGVATREDLAAVRALDAAGVRLLAAGAAVSTDDRNVLATRSPRVLAQPLGMRATALFAPHDPLVPPPSGLDAAYLVRRLGAMGVPERAAHVADAIPEPARRAEARAAIAWSRGERAPARAFAAAALELAPDLVAARDIALLARPAAGGAPPRELPTDEPARTLLAAWRAEGERDGPALAALDERLAELHPPSSLEPEAVRLRAAWRTASGEPARAREAVSLLDGLLARFPSADLLARRAEAAAAAGDAPGALATWLEAAALAGPPARRSALEHALTLARTAELPEPERLAWVEAFEAIAGADGAGRGARPR